MKSFDRKFGKEYFATVPNSPGVYFFYDSDQTLLYVGKAKNLSRRLAQYRNAKRRKKHAKMRTIVAEAASLRWQECASDLEASLTEIRLIQTLKPKVNISGAFSFLYPLIGLKYEMDVVYFVFTTSPDQFPGYEFYGCFRSRFHTAGAFFALTALLRFLGHPVPKKKISGIIPKYSYVFGYRRLPPALYESWKPFFRGESSEALENLSLKLLENAGARAKAEKVQKNLKTLKRFWKFEALPLNTARKTMDWKESLVSQNERDLLFLKFRFSQKEGKA